MHPARPEEEASVAGGFGGGAGGLTVRGEGLRQEVWVRPDGHMHRRTLSQNDDSQDSLLQEIKDLPADQACGALS